MSGKILRHQDLLVYQKAIGEAAETQTWLELAVRCNYLDRDVAKKLFLEYEEIISMLVAMANNPEKWIIKNAANKK